MAALVLERLRVAGVTHEHLAAKGARARVAVEQREAVAMLRHDAIERRSVAAALRLVLGAELDELAAGLAQSPAPNGKVSA